MKKIVLILVCVLGISHTVLAAPLTETNISNVMADSVCETGSEFCTSKALGFIFKEEMNEESVLLTGNVRVNDSVDIIENIELIDKRCLVIILKEQMRIDYRYIVEFYNIKSAAGDITEYTRFDTTIVNNYTGKTILCDRIKTTKSDGITTMTLPLLLNAGTSEKTFYDIYAKYTGSNRYIDMESKKIILTPGTYSKNLTHTNSNTGIITKMFIWGDNQAPVCNEGVE